MAARGLSIAPGVHLCSLENEIIPRLNFLEYLYEKGVRVRERWSCTLL